MVADYLGIGKPLTLYRLYIGLRYMWVWVSCELHKLLHNGKATRIHHPLLVVYAVWNSNKISETKSVDKAVIYMYVLFIELILIAIKLRNTILC